MARILIVEDDELDRTFEWAVLERGGHTIFLAEDGDEAIEKYSQMAIDVVVTDLQMPHVHGLELISLIRDWSPRPAIIAVSGTGADQLDMARMLGAAESIEKPVDPEALLAAVDRALAG